MKADLHMHSVYSDGELDIKSLAVLCKAAGAQVVALTDHDTVAGVNEMTLQCQMLGIKNISGVEISAFTGCDVHILGYGLNVDDPKILKFFADMRAARAARIEKVVSLVQKAGMAVTFERVKSLAVKSISRVHVARAMVKKGYAATIQECFERYLGEGKPCYVPNTKISAADAVRFVAQSGGQAVLAHPVRLDMPDNEKEKLVKQLKEAGLAGIEAQYRDSSPRDRRHFTNLAKKYNLYTTVGGDFHRKEDKILPQVTRSACMKALRL